MNCAKSIASTFYRLENSFFSWSIEAYSDMEMNKNAERGWIAGISILKDNFKDFKIHLRKVYEEIYDGLKQNKEISTNIGYVIHQLSCQDSRIDDLERGIKEVMGKVGQACRRCST